MRAGLSSLRTTPLVACCAFICTHHCSTLDKVSNHRIACIDCTYVTLPCLPYNFAGPSLCQFARFLLPAVMPCETHALFSPMQYDSDTGCQWLDITRLNFFHFSSVHSKVSIQLLISSLPFPPLTHPFATPLYISAYVCAIVFHMTSHHCSMTLTLGASGSTSRA